MAGVAQRIYLAAPARADGHHEAIGCHHAAVGQLDAHRTLHHHRAVGYHLHHARTRSGHGLSALITSSSSSRRPGSRRSVSSSHQARDVSTGPNGIHCHATISASSPALDSAARVRRRVGEFGLHEQQAAAVCQQVGHGLAERIEHQSPVVSGVPCARRSDRGRQRIVDARIMRHVRRIADDGIGCLRSLKSSMDSTASWVSPCRSKDIDDGIARTEEDLARVKDDAKRRQLEQRLVEFRERLERLQAEHVTLQIYVESKRERFEQMFYDVADNALGINQAVKVRFDARKVLNRTLYEGVHRVITPRIDEPACFRPTWLRLEPQAQAKQSNTVGLVALIVSIIAGSFSLVFQAHSSSGGYYFRQRSSSASSECACPESQRAQASPRSSSRLLE